jgi:hypothetical protein
MIRSFVYKTGIIFIVTLLITATGGFSIYRHICYCAGVMSSSFIPEATCGHDHSSNTISCCNDDKTPACCKSKPEKEQKHHCNGHDCCNTSSQFLKINDSFQPGLDKISLKPLVALSLIFIIDFKEDILTAPTKNIFYSDLPPPESGKQIILAHHQLKLDPFLV